MYGVDLYGRVRLAVLGQGLSQREAARRFGIDRGTVRKMLGHSVPPGYRRGEARHRPKLAAHIGFIDQILADDLDTPKKQRHTIQRIYDRLREERGFDGGYTTVRDYVHPRRLTMREAFVPLAHPAGHAQADFGEAWAVVGGTQRKVHFLVMSLPHRDAIFVKDYYVQVLRLIESFPLATVHGAVRDALRLGAISYDAVKHLALCRIEQRPAKLNLGAYPHLATTHVTTTSPFSYMSLLSGDPA